MRNYPDSRIPPAPPRTVVQSKMMNKRIEDLAAQARAYATKQNETTSMPYSQAYEEKYLELMERMVVGAVAESEWFWHRANTNQKTQAYVAKAFRS